MLIKFLVIPIILELALAGFIIWCCLNEENEEKVVAFEDRIIRFVLRKVRRFRRVFAKWLLDAARKVFLFFYIPQRKLKNRLCRRWLSELGMKAVRK